MGPRPIAPAQRAEKFFDRAGAECWEWTGYTDQRGYGRLTVPPGKRVYAHRVVYEADCGPIPEGLELDHLCRNHECVRPSHLEPVTHAENVRRGSMSENNRQRWAAGWRGQW